MSIFIDEKERKEEISIEKVNEILNLSVGQLKPAEDDVRNGVSMQNSLTIKTSSPVKSSQIENSQQFG